MAKQKISSVWNVIRSVSEAAFISLLVFRLLSLFFVYIFKSYHALFYAMILMTHYITVLICGFWAGWRIRVDGWLYGIVAYCAFYVLRQIFNVHYPLPLSFGIKLLMLIPLLALLMISAIYGEIAAERREEDQNKKEYL